MKTTCLLLMFILAACGISPQPAPAAEEEQSARKQSTRSRMIFGPPVNVNIAGPGSMPEGVLLTGINTSFANKITPVGNAGSRASDVFGQQWLLKLRYGITDYLEIWSTIPYINNRRTNPEPNPQYIYGVADSVLALTLCPWHERRGDPLTASASAGVLLPVAAWGKDHMPGMGVMAFRGQAAVGKFLTKDIKIETEGLWITRFARGNQNVRLGDQFQWNSQIRYLFNSFDIGLESSLVSQTASDREARGNVSSMRNGYTEWFVGPSVNVAIEPLSMWVGLGAFFPVLYSLHDERRAPAAKMENVRVEFKIGKLW
ncbi:MAG: transporter [Deltaproteobacteria bacterium]|nr:transporter [Deltaproteobacteria bacterium]